MQTIPEEKIRAASEGLRAIAHEIRLSVLCHLLDGPMCVQELMQATGAAQSNLSQHLFRMRMLGLLQTKKRGQRVYYRLADPKWADVLTALHCIYCSRPCAASIARKWQPKQENAYFKRKLTYEYLCDATALETKTK